MLKLSGKTLAGLSGDIFNTISQLAEKKPLTGLCRELDYECRKDNPALTFQTTPRSFVIPFSELARSLTSGSLVGGGALVGDEVFSEIEKALRPQATIFRAGAKMVFPSGNLSIGREGQPTTFQWLHEVETLVPSDSTFSQIKLSPHRLAGQTSLSRQLDIQTGGILAQFLLDSLSRGIAVGIEAGALSGSGTYGAPVGLLTNSNVPAVTFGGSASWANVLKFEQLIANANGDDESVSFIANPDVRAKWRTIQRVTGGAGTLWSSDENKIAEKVARVTTNVASGNVIAGDFSQLVVGLFGSGTPINVVVDPFTQAGSANIVITVQIFADCAALRPTLFCKNADSAIQ